MNPQQPVRSGTSLVEVGKALGGELRPVLGRTEQRLGVSVVVAHAGSRVRGLDAQPVEHRQYRRSLERGAVVAVQHRLCAQRGNALGQRGAAHQGGTYEQLLGNSASFRKIAQEPLIKRNNEMRIEN